MSNLNENYKRILEVLKKISKENHIEYQRHRPKMSDLDLVSLNITDRYMGIDGEDNLFRLLPKSILSKVEGSVYHHRRSKLAPHIDTIQLNLAAHFNEFEDNFIVDSMPLEVCKLSRSSRSKICKEQGHNLPDNGYCAPQESNYYRYKLHAVCYVRSVFQSIDLSFASIHNVHYLKDIASQISDCTLIGDKGYLSTETQLILFETCKFKLNSLMRNNQKKYKKQLYIFRKSRKRIETLLSQLCDQFMIRRNYAKSLGGYKIRTLSNITSLKIVQYINQFVFNRNNELPHTLGSRQSVNFI